MSNTTLTYLKQRFPLQLFLPLALFIIAYALGSVSLIKEYSEQLIYIFPLLVLQLLAFRIFDDLVSSEEDQEKPNRIYTLHSKIKTIYILLAVVVSITLGYAFYGGEHVLMLVILGYVAGCIPYFFRSSFGQARFIIPLIKYPLIVVGIAHFLRLELIIQYLLPSIALFLGFVFYEMVEDSSIRVSQKTIRIGFWVLVIPFYFLADTTGDLLIITAISSLFFIICVLKPIKYLHFLALILSLILRVIINGI